ncbi:tyrosine-type recombinase/integrase [Gloeomargarita lithophora]|uniref:tyrosine-type recombinase/integrase n=1 Tax=Gloeomargarita lithophora TaxID=1188228 RepID=UPI001E3CCC9C|nr:site-specific integrase [Gloeomargarita lithophora]
MKQSAMRQAETVEAIGREWLLKKSNTIAPSHSRTIEQRLQNDIFPHLGDCPISEVTAQELLKTLRIVEGRGALETAHRELNYLSQIWRYAVATGRVTHDVTYSLRGALPPVKHEHFAAVTDPPELGKYLSMFDAYPGGVIVRAGLRITPHVFVRPGELRTARWVDIDLENSEWRYTVTKTDSQHIVPLSRQVKELFQELLPITGRFEYVFTSFRNKNQPISNMALNAALKNMGISSDIMTAHGFRATARTLLDEVLGFRIDLIEHQLAHNVKDPLGRAYNRTQFLKERHILMQKWSDYLDELKVKYGQF